MSPSAIRRATVAVYCAAHHGNHPEFVEVAQEVGEALATQGVDLVYCGGSVGLMGEVANSMIAHGARATGVITRHLYEMEVAHLSLDELIVVDTMPLRKAEMFDRADAFVVLPGGVGTLEELCEVWCWASLRLHHKPIVLVNVDGFFDSLMTFIGSAVTAGLVSQHAFECVSVANDVDGVVAALNKVVSCR